MPQIADVAMRAVLLPLLLAALPAAAATAEPNFALVDPPKALPDVRFMDGEGRNAALTDFRGKVVLLNVWATWCGPCKGELPGLVKAYETYHSKGFEIVGISLDQEKQTDNLKKFLVDWKMPWPQIYDGKFWQAELAQLYVVNSIPAAFLVDGDTGKVIASGGSLRGELLELTLKKALKL